MTCQRPTCERTDDETYRDEHGNELRVCARCYWRLVTGTEPNDVVRRPRLPTVDPSPPPRPDINPDDFDYPSLDHTWDDGPTIDDLDDAQIPTIFQTDTDTDWDASRPNEIAGSAGYIGPDDLDDRDVELASSKPVDHELMDRAPLGARDSV